MKIFIPKAFAAALAATFAVSSFALEVKAQEHDSNQHQADWPDERGPVHSRSRCR